MMLTIAIAFLRPFLFQIIGGFAVSLALWWGYAHVKGIGYAECKSEWNAANVKAIETGTNARRDGDADAAAGVRDGFDRDQ